MYPIWKTVLQVPGLSTFVVTTMLNQCTMQNSGKSDDMHDVIEAPYPTSFFSFTSNKATFLDCLGKSWTKEEESTHHSTTNPKLYICGGFKEFTIKDQ